MEVSEIEGDAILFYREGNSPGLNKITHDKSEILRIGSKHICAISAGLVELETIQNKKSIKKLSMLNVL